MPDGLLGWAVIAERHISLNGTAEKKSPRSLNGRRKHEVLLYLEGICSQIGNPATGGITKSNFRAVCFRVRRLYGNPIASRGETH